MSSIQKKIEHTIYNCLYKTKINSDIFLSMLLYIKINKNKYLTKPTKKVCKQNESFNVFFFYFLSLSSKN